MISGWPPGALVAACHHIDVSLRRAWRRYEQIVLGGLEKPRVYLVKAGIGLVLFVCAFGAAWPWLRWFGWLFWPATIAGNLYGYWRHRNAAREPGRASVEES